jgi:rare lipoprotein A (peptidoglycan hydrolase)
MRIARRISLVAALLSASVARGGAPAQSAPPPAAHEAKRAHTTHGRAETGIASVYSDRLHGRRTASGEIYDRNELTAAHKTLPFGARVKLTHLKNGRSVTLRITDRGPRQARRIIDITPRAARALGIATWREEQGTVGDLTAVFRDSAFQNDVAKSNLAAIREQHGIKHVRSL